MIRPKANTETEMTGRQFRRTVFWLSFWLIVQGVAVSFGLWQGHHNDQEHVNLVNAEAAEDDIEEAVRCVDIWERTEQARHRDAWIYRRIQETIIEAATSATPERVAAFRDLIERDLVMIAGLLDDPACDLEASQRLLGG